MGHFTSKHKSSSSSVSSLLSRSDMVKSVPSLLSVCTIAELSEVSGAEIQLWIILFLTSGVSSRPIKTHSSICLIRAERARGKEGFREIESSDDIFARFGVTLFIFC